MIIIDRRKSSGRDTASATAATAAAEVYLGTHRSRVSAVAAVIVVVVVVCAYHPSTVLACVAPVTWLRWSYAFLAGPPWSGHDDDPPPSSLPSPPHPRPSSPLSHIIPPPAPTNRIIITHIQDDPDKHECMCAYGPGGESSCN